MNDCPGEKVFERVEEKVDAQIGSVNELCGQIRVLVKVACWLVAPLLICVCVIAMGKELTSEVGKHIPVAAAEDPAAPN